MPKLGLKETPYFMYRPYDLTPAQKAYRQINWNGTGGYNVFVDNSKNMTKEIANAHKRMIKNIAYENDWEVARRMQVMMNEILSQLRDDSYSFQKIMNGLLRGVQNAGDSLKNVNLDNVKIRSDLSAYAIQSKEYKDACKKYQEELDGKPKLTMREIKKMSDIEALIESHIGEQNMKNIRSAQGTLVEAFVSETVSQMSDFLFSSAKEDCEEVKQYAENMIKELKNSVSHTKQKKISLAGVKRRSFVVKGEDGQLTTKRSSMETVDVVVNPSASALGEKHAKMLFNVKNYSKDSGNIHLLSGNANAVDRIKVWEGVSSITKDFYATAYSYYGPGSSNIDNFLNVGHRLFVVQAIIGANEKVEGLANFLVINRIDKGIHRSNVVVLPIKPLLEHIFNTDTWERFFFVKVENEKEYAKPPKGEKGRNGKSRTSEEVAQITTNIYKNVKLKVDMRQSLFNHLAQHFSETGINFN